MKQQKFGRLVLLACLIGSFERVSLAALTAAVQWDVRTTGSNSNGGGFAAGATGTDYSVQDAAQQTYTDLLIGATDTQLTSIAHVFTSTAPGNIINITAGTNCTVGRYQVISQAAGVVTMDRSVGTAGSTCSGKLGGGLLTIATANSLAVSGNTINIQSGIYTFTSTLSIAPNPYDEISFTGYQTTHGDAGTKPLITTATNSTDIFTFADSQFHVVVFDNLSLRNTATTRAQAISNTGNLSGQLTINRSVLDGFSTAVGGAADVGFLNILNTEIKNSTLNGVFANSNGTGINTILCWACYIHNNPTGIRLGTDNMEVSLTVVNSILSANTTAIIAAGNSSVTRTLRILNSDIANNTAGITMTQAAGGYSPNVIVLANNILYGNTGTAVSINNATVQFSGSGQTNAFGGNGTDRNNFKVLSGDITLTSNPFTSAANFALIPGSAAKGAGVPGLFPGGTTTGYLDMGAAQSPMAQSSATSWN